MYIIYIPPTCVCTNEEFSHVSFYFHLVSHAGSFDLMWAFKRQNTSSRLLTSQKANMPTVNPYDVDIFHRPTRNKFKDPIDGDFSCFGETRTYARIATDEFPLRFSRLEVESGWCFFQPPLASKPILGQGAGKTCASYLDRFLDTTQ